MGVVVRKYIDILTIIINFSYSTCISSFFGSSIPTYLLIFKMFFRSCYNITRGSRFLNDIEYSLSNICYIFHKNNINKNETIFLK